MATTKDTRKIDITLHMRDFDGGPLIGSFYVTCGSLFLEHVQITEHTFEAIVLRDVEVDCNDTVNFAIHGHPYNEEFPQSQPIPDYYYQPESISLNEDKNVVINIQQERDEVTIANATATTETEIWRRVTEKKGGGGLNIMKIVELSGEFKLQKHKGGSDATSESESFSYTAEFPKRKIIISQKGGESNELK